MTCSAIWQNFEKFPQIFREIVQKFNIIQYYSILSLKVAQVMKDAEQGAIRMREEVGSSSRTLSDRPDSRVDRHVHI